MTHMITTHTTPEPRVWIGCLACYNEGHLVGDWYPAIDAATITPNELQTTTADHLYPHDELWCFDHEGLPITGECSPLEATRLAELILSIPEDERAPFIAWCDNNNTDPTEHAAIAFHDAYLGHWDSFTDYVYDYIESTGLLDNIPEHVARYFDYDAFERDLGFDHTVLNAPHGVWVFAI